MEEIVMVSEKTCGASLIIPRNLSAEFHPAWSKPIDAPSECPISI